MSKENILNVVVVGTARSGKSEVFKGISPKPALRLNDVSYVTFNVRFEKMPFITRVNAYILPSDRKRENIRKEYYEKADVIFLIFNMNRRETFEGLSAFIDEIFSAKQKTPIALIGWIGLAEDIFEKHEVSMVEAQKFADRISQKTGYHVPFIKIDISEKAKVVRLIEEIMTIIYGPSFKAVEKEEFEEKRRRGPIVL
ncbi:MAG: hypothetical protein ACTSSP_12635 [Candidatus Asgardarchaeia archaeon]